MKEDTKAAAKTIDSLTRNLLECYEELDLIYRLSRGVMSTLNAQRSVELILTEAMEIFDAEVGWVTPSIHPEPAFCLVCRGIDARAAGQLNEAVVGGLLTDGRSRMFYSLSSELGVAGSGWPGALLCAVIKTENMVYGALCLGKPARQAAFTAGDLKLANVLASQAAIAVENSLLHRRKVEEQEALVRLQEEMRLARAIHDNLLPKEAPCFDGYDIAGMGLPARSVGGDYYDFITVGPDRMAVCLGDISGKGMPAALLMANLQATIRGQALINATPGTCLERSNTLLYRSTDVGSFATCFYGILDVRSNMLHYANAGHERPLLLMSDGGHSSLDAGGLVLGVRDGSKYEEASVSLKPDETLILYSDGITEVFDRDGREFGVEGILSAVPRRGRCSSQDVLDAVMSAARHHVGDGSQADDMTLVVVRRVQAGYAALATRPIR